MSVRRLKAKRTVRASKRPVVALTGRDVELLILIGLCRYLSLAQATREFFPSEDRARRRIRQLFDAGLLAVTLSSSIEPNLLSLTRLGLAAVLERIPSELGERVRMAGPIRLAGVRHRLAITDTRIYASHFGRQRGTPLTRWSNAGGELGRERGLDKLHLAPDGMAEFAGSHYVGAEIDCSTESLSVLRSKFDRYRTAAVDQQLHGLWLVVIGGEERQANLRRLVDAAQLSGWAAIIPHDQLLTRPIRAVDLVPGRAESPGSQRTLRGSLAQIS
jgi:hypothetical protein